MISSNSKTTELQKLLEEESELELAVLIGSRVTGNTHSASDWDIALQWKKIIPAMTLLGKTEELRSKIAKLLDISSEKIDLIDIPTAGITMRSVVTEEGELLKGDNTLEWSHFLQRTWRELEDIVYMENNSAA